MQDESGSTDYSYAKRNTLKNEDYVITEMLPGEPKLSSNNIRKNNSGSLEGQVKTGYLPNTSKA